MVRARGRPFIVPGTANVAFQLDGVAIKQLMKEVTALGTSLSAEFSSAIKDQLYTLIPLPSIQTVMGAD